MTYEESAQLMQDSIFRGRIKVAAIKYAGYILAEPATTEAHNVRMRWALQCYQQPDMTATQIQSPVVMDPGVQAEGSAVTDAALQSAVEVIVQKMF